MLNRMPWPPGGHLAFPQSVKEVQQLRLGETALLHLSVHRQIRRCRLFPVPVPCNQADFESDRCPPGSALPAQFGVTAQVPTAMLAITHQYLFDSAIERHTPPPVLASHSSKYQDGNAYCLLRGE